jgi:hypothetical protein
MFYLPFRELKAERLKQKTTRYAGGYLKHIGWEITPVEW